MRTNGRTGYKDIELQETGDGASLSTPYLPEPGAPGDARRQDGRPEEDDDERPPPREASRDDET